MKSERKKITREEIADIAIRDFGILPFDLKIRTTDDGIEFGRYINSKWIEKHEIKDVELVISPKKKKITWEEIAEIAQSDFGIPESELTVSTSDHGGIQFGRCVNFEWVEIHEIENVDLDIPAPT